MVVAVTKARSLHQPFTFSMCWSVAWCRTHASSSALSVTSHSIQCCNAVISAAAGDRNAGARSASPTSKNKCPGLLRRISVFHAIFVLLLKFVCVIHCSVSTEQTCQINWLLLLQLLLPCTRSGKTHQLQVFPGPGLHRVC